MFTIQDLQTFLENSIHEEAGLIGKTKPVNLYEPVNYSLSIGGKRIRPSLLLMAYNLFEEDIEKALPAAIAIEVFHNFTLLHDDIMDRAEMRRGSSTVHKKYGENVAILSGDAMSIMAYKYLLKTQSNNLHEISRVFTQTALEVCEGQQLDMDFESRMDVSIDEYMTMIRLKTAVLIASSLKIGAMVANASNEMADLLYVFGLNLGIAFQLQDDLLDVFASQKKFGKVIGGDIVSNKKTFLLLKALELSDGETKRTLLDWVSKSKFDPEEKVKAVKDIYTKLDLKSITEGVIKQFYQSAMSVWNELDVSIDRKSELLKVANKIMKRDH